MLKIISWNVNGLKSILEKDFENIVTKISTDVICLQETKISKNIDKLKLEGYYKYFNYSKKAGYSGVAIFSKEKAERVFTGIEVENEYGEIENVDEESRVLTVEYNNFFIVSVYVPCSTSNRERINERLNFDNNFYEYISKLNKIKNVIICGDFNVCHKNIDVCNVQKHCNIEVFLDEQRASFNELLDLGFIDTYRFLHPQMRNYTFWTNDVKDKMKNEFGWRLDYILVSDFLKKDIREANILNDINGSDHCPIELVIKV